MIKKLDLGYSTAAAQQKDADVNAAPSSQGASSSQGPENAAPESLQALQPNIPKDFDLFLNLVEFCKLILPTTCPYLFGRWVYIFGKEIITRSNQFPLVSGFYKLLGVAMKICESQKYFKSIGKKATGEVMSLDTYL